MSEVWIHSMNGAPWKKSKMNQAIKKLRHRALISYVVGIDKLEDLQELDQIVFAKRPDLILSISQIDKDKTSLQQVISKLAGLQHVTALQLNLFYDIDLSELGVLKLQYISVMSKKPLNLDFISNYKQLKFASLHGKFVDLRPIGDATELDSLNLQTDIVELDFVSRLPKLTCLYIADCTLKEGALAALVNSNITMLCLASIRNLTHIDEISSMHQLVSLRLALSKLETLCDFSELNQLTQLELEQMKSLKDITPLWTANHLEMLTLWEFSTAIKAKALAPLLDMSQLKQLDFRFIDFNKRRIEALRQMFAEAGKEYILIENIDEPFRLKSKVFLHIKKHF